MGQISLRDPPSVRLITFDRERMLSNWRCQFAPSQPRKGPLRVRGRRGAIYFHAHCTGAIDEYFTKKQSELGRIAKRRDS